MNSTPSPGKAPLLPSSDPLSRSIEGEKTKGTPWPRAKWLLILIRYVRLSDCLLFAIGMVLLLFTCPRYRRTKRAFFSGAGEMEGGVGEGGEEEIAEACLLD